MRQQGAIAYVLFRQCYNLLVFSFLGPHLNFSGKIVPVVLESLVSGPQVALPPVNWVSVLGPIMRANFSELTRAVSSPQEIVFFSCLK